jgi:transcriptional regulator with XRE-family HTH domain
MTDGFGEALRRYRIEAGLNQRDLAEAAGFHQTTISTAERDEKTPGIDLLLGVCSVLEITPDQLFRRAGLLTPEGDVEHPDEPFWELWGVYKRLVPADQQEVLRYARFREEGRG